MSTPTISFARLKVPTRTGEYGSAPDDTSALIAVKQLIIKGK
jgi:hypothetical protein